MGRVRAEIRGVGGSSSILSHLSIFRKAILNWVKDVTMIRVSEPRLNGACFSRFMNYSKLLSFTYTSLDYTTFYMCIQCIVAHSLR